MEKWHKVHPWKYDQYRYILNVEVNHTCLKISFLQDIFFLIFPQEYNLKYVDMIEEQLNEALTTYRKPVDGDNYVRRSNQR